MTSPKLTVKYCESNFKKPKFKVNMIILNELKLENVDDASLSLVISIMKSLQQQKADSSVHSVSKESDHSEVQSLEMKSDSGLKHWFSLYNSSQNLSENVRQRTLVFGNRLLSRFGGERADEAAIAEALSEKRCIS
ncbi:Hypothetical predicted protein [Scomber scombrus]|uniref:Uncharacterized protein n=1 Tax=Scomber scombrus TaxID=13677 RepID=A0AAV1PZ57_SCOSC